MPLDSVIAASSGCSSRYRANRFLIAGPRSLFEFAGGFGGTLGPAFSPLRTSRPDRVDDLGVATVVRDRVGACPYTASRIGSKFEQQFGHCEIALQDGDLQGAHLATAEFGATREKFVYLRQIAALGGLMQFGGRDSVDGGVKLGPAFEAVRAREGELGIV